MKLWHEVAYDVNATNWSDYPLLTDEFVLFVDWLDIDVLDGDLEKSIPLWKLEILQSKGLLPTT
ncbi:hypothetical protein [Paenibacillus herberti]|uniref:Uncharacterized protein n=1 Tax=Paenibacillus herberti TaxID=1619309 RepID=A0A229NXM6_9BACL|nr:hypothetical protein [Paenibacillus herberti]OXM14673.1 hypothetical protein CGZ75_17330 [Paenibacillus herberti]